MQNNVNRNTKWIAAAAVTLAMGSAAHAATWVAGSGEYSTAANWNDGLAPATNSTQDINNGATVDRTVNSTAGRTFVSGGSTMNVTTGVHNDSRSGSNIRNFVGGGSAGTVNFSGASYGIGHMLSIGGGGASGDGVFSQTDGALSIYRGSNNASLGVAGQYSLEVGGNSGGDGLFGISGGSLETRIGVAIGQTGTFSVIGSGASSIGIGSNGTLDGNWVQYGTLSASIDAGGVTPIFVDDVAGAPSVDFLAGSLLNLGFSGPAGTYYNGSWTILELENGDISDAGLGLTAGTDLATIFGDTGWSFSVDNSGANGFLIATHIPEPSLISLLGFGFGSMMLFRRRRA